MAYPNKHGGIKVKNRAGITFLIVVFVICGVLAVNISIDQKKSKILGPPEGYEQPSDRVIKLKIEKGVTRHFGNEVDLVTLGPGSGWLKLKTRDGISPTLSFNRIKPSDVEQFNKFSKSLGVPIKVEFSKNILHVSLLENAQRPVFVADSSDREIETISLMPKDFYKSRQPTRLAIKKDSAGKVFLMAAKDEQKKGPEKKLEEEGVFIARADEGIVID